MSEIFDLDERPPVVALLDSVAGLLDRLGDPAWWRLSDEQTVGAVDAAYRLSTLLHTLGLGAVGEVDRRGLATSAGASSTQAWLRHRQRLRPQQAKRDTTLARLIPADPATADADTEGAAVGAALVAGSIGVEAAGIVATALAELPSDLAPDSRLQAERILVDHAATVTPEELTRLGHCVLERVDPELADAELGKRLEREEQQAHRLRSGSRYADGHGSVIYRFRLSGEDDAQIWPVLDALATPRPAADGVPDSRTATQRMADAFVETCRRVSLDGGLPAKGGDRPRILVTITLAELVTGLGAGTFIDTGDQLSVATVRRLACDAQVIPAVLDGAGRILDLGRTKRTFEGPVRVAVIARDRGCVHPGCDRPARWCDVHHVVPWWQGGETKPANGVVLCGYHHRLYDAGTWGVRFAADGLPEAIPPPWLDIDQKPIRHTRFLARRRT